MAKTTKYIAEKRIVRLNKKDYEVGDEVTGLNKSQEERLQEVGAIRPKNGSDETADDNTDDDSNGGESNE